MKQSELILQQIFLHLNNKGFRLSVRDFADAVAALQAGYGLHSRENLLWLLQTLWANNDEERRIIHLLFDSISEPTDEEVMSYERTSSNIDEDEKIQPKSPESFLKNEIAENPEDEVKVGNSSHLESKNYQYDTTLDVPRAVVNRQVTNKYILKAQDSTTLRSLILIWRRFRLARKIGARTVFDISATIEAKCRSGYVLKPVYSPERVNTAKVIVLVDVSSSMTPWQDFIDLFVDSLSYVSNQAINTKVYYFSNVPEQKLYREYQLINAVDLRKIAYSSAHVPLLIFSDAGAGRRHWNPDRINATKEFIDKVSAFWKPIVWINPYPRKRWEATSAEGISDILHVSMVDKQEESLVYGVDIMRGLR